MKRFQILTLTTILILSFILSSTTLSSNEIGVQETPNGYAFDEPDYWPTLEWRTATPESQGMNSTILRQASSLRGISSTGVSVPNPSLDGMVVIRNGYIVFEQYPSGFGRNALHRIYSCTKSVTSILFGITLDLGLISNISQRVLDFFPDREIANLDNRKGNMTLEHLLTMTTGFDWNEWAHAYGSDDNPATQMYAANDSIQFVLDRAMYRQPGTQFSYCSGASMLLGEIIEIVSGMEILAFARKYLLTPLGIGELYWSRDYWKNISYFSTEGGLWMRPRDMARIGYLMLNNGTWDGQQIVSPEWVNSSTFKQLELGGDRGYGYQWWTTTGRPYYLENFINKSVYYAMGMEGQKICVIPDYNLITVMTGEFGGATPSFYDDVISDVIVESIHRYNETLIETETSSSELPLLSSQSSETYYVVDIRFRC